MILSLLYNTQFCPPCYIISPIWNKTRSILRFEVHNSLLISFHSLYILASLFFLCLCFSCLIWILRYVDRKYGLWGFAKLAINIFITHRWRWRRGTWGWKRAGFTTFFIAFQRFYLLLIFELFYKLILYLIFVCLNSPAWEGWNFVLISYIAIIKIIFLSPSMNISSLFLIYHGDHLY